MRKVTLSVPASVVGSPSPDNNRAGGYDGHPPGTTATRQIQSGGSPFHPDAQPYAQPTYHMYPLKPPTHPDGQSSLSDPVHSPSRLPHASTSDRTFQANYRFRKRRRCRIAVRTGGKAPKDGDGYECCYYEVVHDSTIILGGLLLYCHYYPAATGRYRILPLFLPSSVKVSVIRCE